MSITKIPWTEFSWNPVVGCTKIAEGCRNCYAEKMAYRLQRMGIYPYHDNPEIEPVTKKGWTGKITCNNKSLKIPLHWRKPRKIFVCSMSDLWHEKVPESFIYKILLVTQTANWHTYLILTKRIERAAKVLGKFYGTSDGIKWPFENVWLGMSISTQTDADKNIPVLLQIPSIVLYVSVEPMIEEIYIPLCQRLKLNWFIIGCESGPNLTVPRPCKLEWVKDLIEQCDAAGVPVFVKQLDINGKCSRKPEEWPIWARRQEYPNFNSKMLTTKY